MIKGKKIADYIDLRTISLNLKARNKAAVIKELYENIKLSNLIKDEELAFTDVCAREEMGSTGIGKGVALPHAKTRAVDELIITVGISPAGIEYGALDNEDAKIFFMFLCPEESTQEYLKVLARISRWIKEDTFRESLLKARTADEIVEIIRKAQN